MTQPVNLYQEVVDEYVAGQPWYARRKDTITSVAGMVLQLAQWSVVMAENAPVWVGLLITIIIGVCQALVHARTPGAVTPSMGQRLADKAGKQGIYPPKIDLNLDGVALLKDKRIQELSHQVEDLMGQLSGAAEPVSEPVYPAPAVGEPS